jgi:hypothetical protein
MKTTTLLAAVIAPCLVFTLPSYATASQGRGSHSFMGRSSAVTEAAPQIGRGNHSFMSKSASVVEGENDNFVEKSASAADLIGALEQQIQEKTVQLVEDQEILSKLLQKASKFQRR